MPFFPLLTGWLKWSWLQRSQRVNWVHTGCASDWGRKTNLGLLEVPVAPLIVTAYPVASSGMNDWTMGSEKCEAGNLGCKLNSLLCCVSVHSAIVCTNHSFISLFTDGLGNHYQSGLCCAYVSKDERVGRNMGELRLPCVQLFPKVRSTFLHVSLFINTSSLLTLVYILPPYNAGANATVCVL